MTATGPDGKFKLNAWWDFDVSSYFYRGSTSGNISGEDFNAVTYTIDARFSTNIDVDDWFEITIVRLKINKIIMRHSSTSREIKCSLQILHE